MKQHPFYRKLFYSALSLLLFAAGCSDNSGGDSNRYSNARLLNVADSVLLTNEETYTVKIFYAKGLANMSCTALTAETSDYRICKVASKSSAAAGDSCLALITLQPGTHFGKATVKVRFYNIADNTECGEMEINVVHKEETDSYVDNINGVKLYMQFAEGGTAVLGMPTADSIRLVNTKFPWYKDSILTSETIHRHFPRRMVSMKDYYVARTEITGKLYKAVMGSVIHGQKDDEHALQLSFSESWAFIKKLSELTGRNYRMPSIDEWEYAAIGGQKRKGYTYPGSNNVENVAWTASSSKNTISSPYIVGQKAPNELGLYDMAGNLAEWVDDSIPQAIYKESGELWFISHLYANKGGDHHATNTSWEFYPWCKYYCCDSHIGMGLRLVISRKDYELKPVE